MSDGKHIRLWVIIAYSEPCCTAKRGPFHEHIGGVPPILRFDNMSTAAVHILDGPERKLTDGFSRFMLHYRFQAEFCNPASGNENGNVENKAGYSRRNAFVPVPEITSFDEFNEKLFAWCGEDGEITDICRKTIQPVIDRADAKECANRAVLLLKAAKSAGIQPESKREIIPDEKT